MRTLAVSLAVALAVLTGCSDRKTELFNGPDIVSSVPAPIVYEALEASLQVYEKYGYTGKIWRGGESNSMGQAVSSHAYLLLLDDFHATPVNAVVGGWQWTSTDGYPDGRIHYIHQVIARGDDALRTAGMNNSFADVPMHREQYHGTLVQQGYFQ